MWRRDLVHKKEPIDLLLDFISFGQGNKFGIIFL